MSKIFLPQLSMEAIAYQRQSLLFFDIVSVLQQLRELPVIDQAALDRSGLSEIVKRRTGLSVHFQNNVPGQVIHSVDVPVYTATAAEIPLLSITNPLYKAFSAIAPLETATAVVKFQHALRLADTLKGTIDLKSGRASGAFSQLTCIIWLDSFVLHPKSIASVEEATALVIHEIGHIFSTFETCAHAAMTNAVVNTALDVIRDAPQDKKIEFILQAIDSHGGDRTDAAIIAESEDETTQRLLLLRNFEHQAHARMASHSTKTDSASYRSVEFMADQYAIRHGGAVPLASAIHKLMVVGKEDQGKSFLRFYGVEAVRYGVMLAALFTPTWPIAALVALTYTIVGATLIGQDDYVPSPQERLGGVKQDLVQLLKNPKLSPSIRKQLLLDLDFVDTLRDDVKSYTSLTRFVWKNLFPDGRRQTKIRDFQKGLEDLINNDIFIHAQRLKALATTQEP